MHLVELLHLEGGGALQAQRSASRELEGGALLDLHGRTGDGEHVLVPIRAAYRIRENLPDLFDRRFDQGLLPPGGHQERTASRARAASAGAPSRSYSPAASSSRSAAVSGSESTRSRPRTLRQRAASSGRPSSSHFARACSIRSAAASASSVEAPAASAIAARPPG